MSNTTLFAYYDDDMCEVFFSVKLEILIKQNDSLKFHDRFLDYTLESKVQQAMEQRL